MSNESRVPWPSIYRELDKNDWIHQWDIFSYLDIQCWHSSDAKKDYSHIESTYFVVMSQQCDLNRDYLARKANEKKEVHQHKHNNYLENVLVCPAYNFDLFCKGNHINLLNMTKHIESEKADTIKKQKDKFIQNDSYKRYHYLVNDEELWLPELIIDFKSYITIPTTVMYTNYHLPDWNYVATLEELFRESVCQRFVNFFSRIALPEYNKPN